MVDAITADEVIQWSRLDNLDSTDTANLDAVVNAVNKLVTDWHGASWPSGCHHGAVMLAARGFRRRNSPGGVESMGEMGGVYTPRYDADLDRHLRINDWAAPKVG